MFRMFSPFVDDLCRLTYGSDVQRQQIANSNLGHAPFDAIGNRQAVLAASRRLIGCFGKTLCCRGGGEISVTGVASETTSRLKLRAQRLSFAPVDPHPKCPAIGILGSRHCRRLEPGCVVLLGVHARQT